MWRQRDVVQACIDPVGQLQHAAGTAFRQEKKGRAEALERRETTAMYLRALFREQHATRWSELLEEYLNRPV